MKRAYTRFNNGDSFGRLVILSHSGKYALCQCSCGTAKVVGKNGLRSGRIVSCGCFKRQIASENAKVHGMSKTRIFKSWHSMLQRCSNPNSTKYMRYGGRGISVCDEWRNSFENFYKDMGERPNGMSLDRIDNNGNYCKSNCKWSTQKEQCNNRNFKFKWTIGGIDFNSLKQASKHFGVSCQTIKNWCDSGKNESRVLRF